MFSKAIRIILMLTFFLGACSSATDETVDAGEAVAEEVEDTSDDELAEEEEEEDSPEEEVVEAEEASEEEVEEEVVEEDEPAVEEPAPGEVVLLDAGEEPRQELRYTIEAGTELLSLAQTSSQTQAVDGEVLGPELPAIGTVVDTEITRTIDGDLIIVDSEIISTAAAEGTDPATAAIMEEAFVPTLGLMTSATLDNRGVVVDAESGVTGDPVIDELLAGLEGATNPLPIEAVGVGATWQVDIAQEAFGLSIINRSTSVIREFTENGVILDVTIEQFTTNLGEEVDFGGGVLVTVEAWDISGSGFTELAFDQISPVRGESSVSGTQVFTAAGEGTLEQTLMVETVITGG